MNSTRVLLDWVKEQVPALKSRVAETHAAVERSRVAGDALETSDVAPECRKARRAA